MWKLVGTKDCAIFLVLASQEMPFWALGKWKMGFLKIFGNHTWHQCFMCQTTPMFPIWAPHMKVCIWNDHKPVVLAWNLFVLTHEMIACASYFCMVCQNPSLSFILGTIRRKGTPCQRVWFSEHYFDLFEFFENCGKTTDKVNTQTCWVFEK